MNLLFDRLKSSVYTTVEFKIQSAGGSRMMRIGDLEIDFDRHQVLYEDKLLNLTPKEYDLLVFFARNKDQVFSREQLLDKVWDYKYAVDTRTVDVHVRWLRKKIEADPAYPEKLLTVRGVGYKLVG